MGAPEDREPLLCVFAKPPEAGRVKTRLVPTLGEPLAAALAAALLEDCLAVLRSLGWGRIVVASTGPFNSELVPLLGGLPLWQQGPGDLGAEVERIVRRGLARAPAVLALGADSPGLPAAGLEAARDAVLRGEAALGPADDGGFWVLALDRCPEGLLSGLPWSSAETCVAAQARLLERGFEVRLVDRHFDIDRPEDLARLSAGLRDGTIDAPATARLLGEHQDRDG